MSNELQGLSRTSIVSERAAWMIGLTALAGVVVVAVDVSRSNKPSLDERLSTNGGACESALNDARTVCENNSAICQAVADYRKCLIGQSVHEMPVVLCHKGGDLDISYSGDWFSLSVSRPCDWDKFPGASTSSVVRR